jgi:Response regulator containing a CheY-like receiver domain and an HTH DNA-binding domain
VIEILLVDDHPSVGVGTKTMIEQESDMKVTVVTSSTEVLELLKSRTFEVLMFDLNIPVINGLELTRRVRVINSDTPIIIYTGYDISSHYNILIEARVSGFVSKTASREQLITVIRCALRGEAVIPVTLLQQLRRNGALVNVSENEDRLEGISINEKEQVILQEVAKGKSNSEIANVLLMSQRSVEYNLTRIFGKLKVRSRAEAIFEAKRLGLIPNENYI